MASLLAVAHREATPISQDDWLLVSPAPLSKLPAALHVVDSHGCLGCNQRIGISFILNLKMFVLDSVVPNTCLFFATQSQDCPKRQDA